MDELTTRLAAVLRQHLQFLPAGEALALDAELAQLGLDSMGAVGLILDLEGEFAVAFPEEMLNEETFRTAGTLREAIGRLVAGGAA